MFLRSIRDLLLVSAVALVTGCTGPHALARLDTGERMAVPIAWYSPAIPGDRASLSRWRMSVGPPLFRTAPSVSVLKPSNEIAIVTWNTALGAGDIVGFVRQLRAAGSDRPLVILLQEVYRRGDAVPRGLTHGAAFARRVGGATNSGVRTDIDSVAAVLGMAAFYVPSMRNGGAEADEDRGNAILSNVPISNLEAIELPFERQRRVAVAATVEGTTTHGRPWRLRVASAHVDNSIPRRGWIGSEYGRARQTRGLVSLLDGDAPTVLGADLNTWFGFSDQAYREAARVFPQTPTDDGRATFLGVLRLDHLLCRLPPGWQASARRAAHRYGSDHSPLIGSVRFN